jgi:hypothetical protein
VEPRLVVWIREFLLGHTQRVRVGGQLLEEVRGMSGVLQGSVLGLLLSDAYVNDIWKNTESNIRLFAGDRIIYRKILSNNDMGNLQIDLNMIGEWPFENEMTINPAKSKAVKNGVFWDVTPCGSCKNQRFGGT